jgi:hypothetical protein
MTADDLERRLREELHHEAARIHPRERRSEILAMVHTEAQQAEPAARRWLIPISAAASVALIGTVVWGATNNGGIQQAAPATTRTTASSSSPNPVAPAPNPVAPTPNPVAPTPNPSQAASSNAGVPTATTTVSLPAYFVGASSGTGDRFGLYREFVRTTVPVAATPAQKARAAVAVAMNAQPFTNYEPYLQPWSGTTVKSAAVTPSLISITLSGPGAQGFTAEQTRLAVQQLVWTAQAAVAKGAVPVKFVVANGSTKLFGTYPTTRTYNRPAKDLHYRDLAPIWITSPARGQVLPAGTAVVAKGESCAFEATTQWQLKRGTTTIKSGFTTASSGCPTRGSWEVKLGVLPAGSYTFQMYETSMENGQDTIAETSKPFTVR